MAQIAGRAAPPVPCTAKCIALPLRLGRTRAAVPRAAIRRERASGIGPYRDGATAGAIAAHDRVTAETRTGDGRKVSIAGEPPADGDPMYGRGGRE